jgi:hypothetical protein
VIIILLRGEGEGYKTNKRRIKKIFTSGETYSAVPTNSRQRSTDLSESSSIAVPKSAILI